MLRGRLLAPCRGLSTRLPTCSSAASLGRTLCTTSSTPASASSGPGSSPKLGKPLHISDIEDVQLFMLAKLEGSAQVPAARERMRREIMREDGVDYDGATPKLLELNRVNAEGLFFKKLPYQLTWFSAVFGGWISLPLVFSVALAKPFNKLFVTMDVPENGDLDTMLEVGSWTWNWMEPPLGTISFFLLCMQFGREAQNNLGSMTPHMRHKTQLAAALSAKFPQYSKDVVSDYAMAIAFQDDKEDIMADEAMRTVCRNEKPGV